MKNVKQLVSKSIESSLAYARKHSRHSDVESATIINYIIIETLQYIINDPTQMNRSYTNGFFNFDPSDDFSNGVDVWISDLSGQILIVEEFHVALEDNLVQDFLKRLEMFDYLTFSIEPKIEELPNHTEILVNIDEPILAKYLDKQYLDIVTEYSITFA